MVIEKLSSSLEEEETTKISPASRAMAFERGATKFTVREQISRLFKGSVGGEEGELEKHYKEARKYLDSLKSTLKGRDEVLPNNVKETAYFYLGHAINFVPNSGEYNHFKLAVILSNLRVNEYNYQELADCLNQVDVTALETAYLGWQDLDNQQPLSKADGNKLLTEIVDFAFGLGDMDPEYVQLLIDKGIAETNEIGNAKTDKEQKAELKDWHRRIQSMKAFLEHSGSALTSHSPKVASLLAELSRHSAHKGHYRNVVDERDAEWIARIDASLSLSTEFLEELLDFINFLIKQGLLLNIPELRKFDQLVTSCENDTNKLKEFAYGVKAHLIGEAKLDPYSFAEVLHQAAILLSYAKKSPDPDILFELIGTSPNKVTEGRSAGEKAVEPTSVVSDESNGRESEIIEPEVEVDNTDQAFASCFSQLDREPTDKEREVLKTILRREIGDENIRKWEDSWLSYHKIKMAIVTLNQFLDSFAGDDDQLLLVVEAVGAANVTVEFVEKVIKKDLYFNDISLLRRMAVVAPWAAHQYENIKSHNVLVRFVETLEQTQEEHRPHVAKLMGEAADIYNDNLRVMELVAEFCQELAVEFADKKDSGAVMDAVYDVKDRYEKYPLDLLPFYLEVALEEGPKAVRILAELEGVHQDQVERLKQVKNLAIRAVRSNAREKTIIDVCDAFKKARQVIPEALLSFEDIVEIVDRYRLAADEELKVLTNLYENKINPDTFRDYIEVAKHCSADALRKLEMVRDKFPNAAGLFKDLVAIFIDYGERGLTKASRLDIGSLNPDMSKSELESMIEEI